MKHTVLIADDEFPARKMLRMYLQQLEGYAIVGEAANGRKALELFRELQPDVLITDIQMPIMNGLDLIEAIRAEKEDQVVIILSCYESFTYAQRAIRLGVRDYLVKDMINAGELEACLNRATAQTSAISQPLPVRIQDVCNVRGILPAFAPRIEQDLQQLSNGFFTWDKHAATAALRRLYKAHLSGMTQYCFLQQINNIVISWIVNECVRRNLPTSQVLKGSGSPLSLLQSIDDPQTALEAICGWIGNLMDQVVVDRAESDRIRQVITYLNENYNQDLSLQDVADHFHIHKVYLARSFKEETGSSLISYLSFLRIEKAKLLLCMKAYRTNEIAFMVGFNNTQSFYNVFRKLVGCSPSDYMEGSEERLRQPSPEASNETQKENEPC